MDKRQRKQVRFSVTYILFGLLATWLFQSLIFRPLVIQQTEVPYSQFRQDVERGKVETVTLGGERILFTQYRKTCYVI